MSLWTRITSALSQIGSSVGAYLAQLAEKPPPEKSVAFTIGMIALGAKMAKADGRVTWHEVEAFKQVFHVPQENLKHVARVFDLAKQDVTGFEAYARQVTRLFGEASPVLEDVLDGLFHIAKADNHLHERELSYLGRVAELFGFSAEDFRRIKAQHVAEQGAEDPYAILGVKRDDELATIKARYRKLVRDNHPDLHMAQGVPEEMVELATLRLQQINAAWDRIEKERAR
jgi:DnaJ like chaperone protein